MKNSETLTLFYLPTCPYCIKAQRAVDELKSTLTGPALARLNALQWIDESANAALAEQYDYYYVPALFRGKEKLFEAKPGDSYETIRDGIRKAVSR